VSGHPSDRAKRLTTNECCRFVIQPAPSVLLEQHNVCLRPNFVVNSAVADTDTAAAAAAAGGQDERSDGEDARDVAVSRCLD